MSSHAAVVSDDHTAEVAQPSSLSKPSLTIVIPALNEEQSIRATIEACLDARATIRQTGRIGEIELIVVSDGSTDGTADIARDIAAREPAVTVIVFETNRGYGAAIQEGFGHASGELLAFLDADGTCDPNWFGEMCLALQEEHAAVVLGSRMGRNSRMPWIRRLGNRIYAFLLGCLSGFAVTDTASGMRVLRRSALADLYPLPSGLHFTPAMSARAVMSDLRVVEVSIPYAERTGESKLLVIHDGLRFLLVIRDALFLYRPGRFFGALGAVALLVGLSWGLYPIEFYWRTRHLEEWMIYRLLLAGFLVSSCCLLVFAAILANQILSLVYPRHRESFWQQSLQRIFSRSHLLMFALLATIAAVVLVWPGLLQYVRTSRVTVHWSRPLAAIFLLQAALLAVIHAIFQKIVSLWKDEIGHRMSAHAGT